MTLNNREWAIVIWLAVLGVWAFSRRDVRSSFGHVLRALAEAKLLIPLACMAAWVACEVWLGAQFQIWAPELGKDTGIWFVTSGLVLFFNFGDASREPRFFQRKVVAALAPIALLEALVDTFILPLPAEILLQPLIAFLVLLAFVAGKEKRQRQVKRLAGALVGMIGLALLGRAAVMTVTGWQELDKTELLLQIALPIWLTLGLLPLHLRRGIRRIVRTSVPAS